VIVLDIDPGATIGYALVSAAIRPAVLDHGKTRELGAVLGMIRGARARRELLVVAVEAVGLVYQRDGFGPRMAGYLAASSRQVGELVEAARAEGCPVLEVECREWRRQLCGKHNAGDTAVETALMLCGLLPKRSNPHSRDAIGIARHGWLWATRTPEGKAAVTAAEEQRRALEWDEVLP